MTVKKTHRPDFLTALCVLTFIGSSAAFVIYLSASLFHEKVYRIIEISSLGSAGNISPLYFFAFAMLNLASLAGAIRMWKLHRDGFFLYTVSQLVILFLPVFYIDRYSFSFTAAIFTAVFVLGYAFCLKAMKKH